MPFSRLSALVPPVVGHYLASTFSVRHHPTVIRYRAILAQAFYHHGRLCASNQATIMVLVILFVAMISYPALVTYYNSYILTSHHQSPNAAFPKTPFGVPGGPASLRRSDLESGNLDEFWSGIIEPTWSQDPAMFQKTLPTKPMHYLAPVIINATDTSVKYENGAGPGILSDAEVLVYAAEVQQRLQSISVDLTEDMLLSPQTLPLSLLSTILSDPADPWEEVIEADEDMDDTDVEDRDDNNGKMNALQKHPDGHERSEQENGDEERSSSATEGQDKKKGQRQRRQRKVSLLDICVFDPQSLHHPPADRGYARIWAEEEQYQQRRATGEGGSLINTPSSSSLAVAALDAISDHPERDWKMTNEGDLTEQQTGTSFGSSSSSSASSLSSAKQSLAPSPSPSLPQSDESLSPPSPPKPRSFECLIQSPVAYWQNDIERIRADQDILGTISSRQNSTLPLSQSTLFGGRVLNQQTNQVQGATSVIMTFFLRGNSAEMYPEEHQMIYGNLDREDHHGYRDGADELWRKDLDVVKVWTALFNAVMRELRHEREVAWLKAHPQSSQDKQQPTAPETVEQQQQQLRPIRVTSPESPNAQLEFQETQLHAPTPSVVMMKVSQDVELGHGGFKRLISRDFAKPNTNISAEYWLLAMAYFVMFLYISLSVGRVDLVKSKYGLGIAAVATVFVSLVMSIGICSVFGVTLTLMPWEILPFMIIVVGVENINILVHAVVETSMDLPVKERVGRGLGAVGVSITMTLLAELCILIVGAMTTIPAVQEFCTFAIAAVIMDYVLQMTFFITVISIDIRRLELTDLSATGHRLRGVSFKYPYANRHHHHHHAHPHMLQYGPYFSGAKGTSADNKTVAADHPFLGRPRSDSNESADSDEAGKGLGKTANNSPKGRIFTSILMVSLMGYLGYIYGTTNQTLENEGMSKTEVSFWHIASPDVSSAFWKLVDPGDKGGYLEICPPVVLTMATPLYSANGSECVVFPQGASECETTEGRDEEDLEKEGKPDIGLGPRRNHGKDASIGKGKTKSKRKGKKGKTNKDSEFNDGTLDPRRPFKMLKNGIVFFCLFVFWLLRVLVVPSMTLAAAILVLLSYLLSPQRKLLVDLQWRFPFIVLPGDYQSKRQLMMEQLLAQEARELGLDTSVSSVAPLPGVVETFKRGGHVTDIEQMDVSPAGLILSSSMDKKILLWYGGASPSGNDNEQTGKRLPLARLLSTTTMSGSATPHPYSTMMTTTGESTKRIVRCLRLDSLARFAAVGYADGGVHLWKIDSVAADLLSITESQQQDSHVPGWVPELTASLELQRSQHQADSLSPSESVSSSRDRVTTLRFWNDSEAEDDDEDDDGGRPKENGPSIAPSNSVASATSLFVGYRDGQVCEWCPQSGRLCTSIQTKHRGGVAELALVRLTLKTRQNLGLSQHKTYLVTAGKDGGLQCWVRFATPPAIAAAAAASVTHHGQPSLHQQPAGEDQSSWQWSRIWNLPGDGSGSSIVVLSVDKQVPMVATGTANGAIKVWDLEQGNLIWTLSRGTVSPANASPVGPAGVGGPTSGFNTPRQPSSPLQSRKQSLGSAFENHQPSHQAAVTRIMFKPLELEDGITGEPAPRVWLIISSGMDEAVMVWMVEWEGLLSMATASGGGASSTRSPSLHLDDSLSTASGEDKGLSTSSLAPPPPMLRTIQRSNSQINLHHHLGTLSTSLPAPRLVGYMKQRGGKSVAIRHTSIFGVRRKENTALTTATASSSGSGGPSILSARKQSYASVLDAAGLYQQAPGHLSASSASGNLRHHRSKSDAGSAQMTTASMPGGNNSSTTKRGWEVWEADLYQCIFKDPGVWGLDLAVRTIDLQPTTFAGPSSGLANSASVDSGSHTGSMAASASTPSGLLSPSPTFSGGLSMATGLGVGMPMVTTNGSSTPTLVSYDPSGAMTPKSRLRRRPGGSLTSNSLHSPTSMMPTQGYVYSMADTTGAQPLLQQPMLSGRTDPSSLSPLDRWMDEPAMALMEEPEPDLLPFVETRHIFAVDYMPWTSAASSASLGDSQLQHHPTPPPLAGAVSPPGSPLTSSLGLPPPPLRRWPSEQNVQAHHPTASAPAPPNEMGGIIVGFGNWIKVVHLHDDDEEEDLEGENPYGYDGRSPVP